MTTHSNREGAGRQSFHEELTSLSRKGGKEKPRLRAGVETSGVGTERSHAHDVVAAVDVEDLPGDRRGWSIAPPTTGQRAINEINSCLARLGQLRYCPLLGRRCSWQSTHPADFLFRWPER